MPVGKCQKWSLYKAKGAFSMPVVQEDRRMAHPALTRAFLQAAATAVMHCQSERCTNPPPTASAENRLHQHVAKN